MDSVSFITNMSDQHRDWIVNNLIESIYDPGDLIVVKGKKNHRMYVIEKGKVGVAIGNDFNDYILELGPGRVAGEISFINHNDVANATLVAIEKSNVFHISYEKIRAKMDEDIHFAADFYKALGVFIARKLKRTNEL